MHKDLTRPAQALPGAAYIWPDPSIAATRKVRFLSQTSPPSCAGAPFAAQVLENDRVFFERYPKMRHYEQEHRKTIGAGDENYEKCMENDRCTNLLRFTICFEMPGKR